MFENYLLVIDFIGLKKLKISNKFVLIFVFISCEPEKQGCPNPGLQNIFVFHNICILKFCLINKYISI